jgi:type I restriction enzyme, S subunit
MSLGDVCSVITDGSHFSPTTVTDGVPYVTVRDLSRGRIDFENSARISTQDFSVLEASGCRPMPGDVLFSKDGTIGRVATVQDERPFVVLSSLAILRPIEALILPNFLALALTSSALQAQVMAVRSGTALRRIILRNIRPLKIPVPPLDEQRHIVDVLEDHLPRLDAAERSLERSDSSAKALVRAALQSGLRGTLVTDDLSEGAATDLLGEVPSFTPKADERVWPVPDAWAWARVGDLFEVNVGATPSRATAAHWSGDLPWVSSGEVAFRRISSTREHITREAAGNPARRIHPPGTVMLAMIGEGRTRGQAAILDIEAAHNQNCASIRVSATKILPEYIYGYLEERYLETRRGGSGGQQPALNKAAIQRFPVPIAPLGTQRRLVEAWTEVRDAAGRLEYGIRAATLRRSTLRRALLEAAFSGRLTGYQTNQSAAKDMIGA